MITELSDNPSVRHREIEQAIRTALLDLPALWTLTSQALVERIADPSLHRDVYKAMGKLAKCLTGLYTIEEGPGRGPMMGKTVKRKVWHHIPTAAMPEPPATPSRGAASMGTSVRAEVAELRARVEALDIRLAAVEGSQTQS